VENLLSIKAILRLFALIYGLKVNFHKSKRFRINLKDGFQDLATTFSKVYRIDKFPFIYLCLPMGANPRKESNWKPDIDVVKN
jgi:hypothetical protein